ncbi:MAG: aminoglycoside phosphotransferase [Firmicutes bacterium]|nr:aminoglycoside phosphotransferase [Bacillota bacterium]
MMKLKKLILDTDPFACKALNNWEYDKNTLRFFRGSSNFIYDFKYNNARYFLRLTNKEDKSLEQIYAEREYLLYLRDNNYNSCYLVKSKSGNYVETIETKEGIFYAVVFNEVKGKTLDINEMTEKQFEKWGESLGKLHYLSMGYTLIKNLRKSYKDTFCFIEEILSEALNEDDAKKELENLRKYFSTLQIDDSNYGLIHYDFELDNVFWDEKKNEFNVIDFDDSMYHWYVMDIVCGLRDLESMNEKKSKLAFKSFIKGYEKYKKIDKKLLDRIDLFDRFEKLYRFTRLLRSLKDSDFKQKPDWLKVVRPKLLKVSNELREGFKKYTYES